MGEYIASTLTCSTRRQDLVHFSPYCVERPYLCIEVPGDAQDVLSVRYIVTSHDQGFSGTSREVPPYEMSFTWFSVYAVRVNGQKDPRRIKLQSNYRADRTFRTHDIVWDYDHPDEEKTTWLASLRRGDIIQLYPRAFYSAWVNIVRGVEMVVTYKPLPVDTLGRVAEPEDLQTSCLFRPGYSLEMALEYPGLSTALREIRMLEVLPGAYNDDIRCYLTTAALECDGESAPQFEALSYCWGEDANSADGDGRTCITLLGQQGKEARQFFVSRSVELAIRHLRHADGQKRVMWIDTVCINQGDLEERAQQVKIMHDIYAAAAHVNVWLGEGDARSLMAVRILRDIYNADHGDICPGGLDLADGGCTCSGTRHQLTGGDRSRLSSNVFQRMHQIFDIHSAALVASCGVRTESLYHAMAALFGIAWFRRVWVFQEALAGSSTVVHCGRESIPWEELVSVHALFDRPDNTLSPLHSAPQALMPPLWEMLREKEKSPSIVDVLLYGIEAEASDRRDKLFALLPFGRETSRRTRRLPTEVQPNYTKSEKQVFADLTRWLLREQFSLDSLSLAVHSQPGRTWEALQCPQTFVEPVDWPTWAFGANGMKHWTYATLLQQFDFCAGGGAATPLDVALLDMPQDRSDKSTLILRLRGFQVGFVTQITSFPLDQVTQRTGETADQEGRRDWAELLEAFTAIFDPGCVVKTWVSSRVHARTGRGSFRNADPDSVMRTVRDHMRAHWEYGAIPPNVTADLDRWENGRYQLTESMDVPPCIGRCLMVVADGKVGLCPDAAREGDIVVILYGGKVPLLLRPIVSTTVKKPLFKLVGECFLQGVMHGEFVGDQLKKGTVPDVFSLA